jgi:site-specific DNA recombinase
MRASIYARKSNDQSSVSDDQRSVARQVEHARAYAARKGWAVADEHVYIDEGISGAEFANRPGFVRLMNELKPRAPFQILVMSEESRLGREAIETAYALKQLVQAGVRVFFYLEDRERTLDSPTDKILLSLTAFADELEREKARQRTYDAMQRKARAGHVTGGRLFGYDNVEVVGADGQRSHVERRINETDAAVVRQIFALCAEGLGVKAIAKRLNATGAPSPRSQQGRSQSWAPSSVRAVLFRPVYRGEILWNQTRKRDTWGRRRGTDRPEGEWLRVSAPTLRIVTDEAWQAAHARLDSTRAVYLKGTKGLKFGRPPLAGPSPYLLTNLATCACCGDSLRVRTRIRAHARRVHLYGCAGYHDRGICGNGADIPMNDADGAVIETLLEDLITPDVVDDAIDGALALLTNDGHETDQRRGELEQEIAKVERERARLAEAIAAGGQLSGLLDAIRTREARLTALHTDLDGIVQPRASQAVNAWRVRRELQELAARWRQVLTDDPRNARPIVTSLVIGRVTFQPLEGRRWQLRGTGTLRGLFEKTVFPVGMASPGGLEPPAPRLGGECSIH